MNFMPPIKVANDPATIRLIVVDYNLEIEAFAFGVAFYKRVPLPIGSVKIVCDTTFYCRLYVVDKIKCALSSAIRHPINGTTITWIESKLREVVTAANNSDDLSLYNEDLGYVVNAEPEYFDESKFKG